MYDKARGHYPKTPELDRQVIDQIEAACGGMRARLYLGAMEKFDRENLARRARGLRPLKRLLPRHLKPVLDDVVATATGNGTRTGE